MIRAALTITAWAVPFLPHAYAFAWATAFRPECAAARDLIEGVIKWVV